MTMLMPTAGRAFLATRSLANVGKNRVRIQLFGDSVMRGYLAEGGGVRAGANPQNLSQDFFDRLYGVSEVSVTSRAVDSTHAGMLLNGTDGLNQPWPGSVDADLVLINHGVNDAAYTAAGQWSQVQYTAALQGLIAESPKRIIFLTPTPVSNSSPNFAPAMRTVAASTGITIIDVRQFIETVPNWYASYAPDGIHLNDAGYKMIYSQFILPALKPIVDQISGRS